VLLSLIHVLLSLIQWIAFTALCNGGFCRNNYCASPGKHITVTA